MVNVLLQPQRQQQFLHLAAERARVGQEQVLRDLLGDGGAALHHAAGREVDPGGARQADRVDAGMVPEAPVLDRDHGGRQVRRQVASGAAARRRCRRRWRRRGRCGPPASGWGGGRRPARLPAAAGRARTTAASAPSASAPQTAAMMRLAQQPETAPATVGGRAPDGSGGAGSRRSLARGARRGGLGSDARGARHLACSR